MYTKKEYASLIEQAPAYNLINNINLILVRGHCYNGYDRVKYTNIEEYITKSYPQISRLFFEIPLKSMPLFINHEFELFRAIALWRLKIAK